MARKKLLIEDTPVSQVKEDELESLVLSYFNNKSQENKFKKLAGDENKRIKELITKDDDFIVKDSTKRNHRTITVGNVIAEYYDKESKDMNEEALIEFLNDNGYAMAISMKPYVNTDVLKEMIYDGAIQPEHLKEMKRFETVKITPTLMVKAVK